ncbi:hypothetical protein WN943_020340 [Citrus x changshan-huyou]
MELKVVIAALCPGHRISPCPGSSVATALDKTSVLPSTWACGVVVKFVGPDRCAMTSVIPHELKSSFVEASFY